MMQQPELQIVGIKVPVGNNSIQRCFHVMYMTQFAWQGKQYDFRLVWVERADADSFRLWYTSGVLSKLRRVYRTQEGKPKTWKAGVFRLYGMPVGRYAAAVCGGIHEEGADGGTLHRKPHRNKSCIAWVKRSLPIHWQGKRNF